MREIKFRQAIFDKSGKFLKWHYWGFLHNAGIVYFEGPVNNPPLGALKNTYQYTGKNDKNDGEIYEGDIAEEYIDGIGTGREYSITWDEEWLAYKFGRGMLAGTECKVIGNIYENSELCPE